MAKQFIAGLDLGQASDYSALVLVERREDLGYDPAQVKTITEYHAATHWSERSYTKTRRVLRQPDGTYTDVPTEAMLLSHDVRHIERFKLGTPYPQIVRETVDLLSQPPLAEDTTLVIDGTGVGRAVCDLFTEARNGRYSAVRVIITSGNHATYDQETGYWHVPKRDLVSCVQVALQNRQVRYPEANKMRWVKELTQELGAFKYKMTQAGNDTYGAWRERDHDDLVLALALAVWQAERNTPIYVAWVGEDD